jgi:hypothetical protein
MQAIRAHGRVSTQLAGGFHSPQVNVKVTQTSESELPVLPLGMDHGAPLSECLMAVRAMYTLGTSSSNSPSRRPHGAKVTRPRSC